MNKNIKTKWFTIGTYILLVLVTLLIGYVLLNNNKALNKVITSFFEVAENRTFDYRQMIKVNNHYNNASKEIVILAIDDPSLELLWDKYGEWPIPRKVYGDVVKHIEKSNPKAILFDLLFIKSMKNDINSDTYFVETLNKYDNIYTSMNFDKQPFDVRKPIDLPTRLSFNLINNSEVNIDYKYSFTNCRPILTELLNGNIKVGIVNIIRNNDGIIRKIAPLLKYKDRYYPYLALKASIDYLDYNNSNDLIINKNSELLIKETKIPLNKDGETILNWYGISGTHTVYPFYKVIKEMENPKTKSNLDFNNKIILIGTTATSLLDTKSVPIQEGIYPGVEVLATFINNMIDNNFIKQTPVPINCMIILSLITIIGIIVMLSTSIIFPILSTALVIIGYLFISYYMMVFYNLWIPIVIPIISIVLAFSLSYLAKYLIKSRDFEHQYKLATIDGLTELYNHRYFQEMLMNQIELSKRYNQNFSLIMIDIDFFKKFNDKYGHQAGDAVLKQVAQTLKKNTRITDYVCRYGGEEMSIILPNTSIQEALLNAKRINQAVSEQKYQLSSNEYGNVTISVGIASFPQDAETAQDLIAYADKGLYYAKEHGRNQVIHFEK